MQFTKDQTSAIVKDEEISTSSDGQLLAYYKQSKGAKTEFSSCKTGIIK